MITQGNPERIEFCCFITARPVLNEVLGVKSTCYIITRPVEWSDTFNTSVLVCYIYVAYIYILHIYVTVNARNLNQSVRIIYYKYTYYICYIT